MKTKKARSFVPLKDKNLHLSFKIRGDYRGETGGNVFVRYDEQNEPSKKSEPDAHLEKNIGHFFYSRILCNVPSNARLCNNIETVFVAIMRPSLNK